MSRFKPIESILHANWIAPALGYEHDRFIFGHNGARMGIAKLGDRSFSIRAFGDGFLDQRRVCQFSRIFNSESGKFKYCRSALLIPTSEQILDHKMRRGQDLPRISFEHERVQEDGTYTFQSIDYSATDSTVKICDPKDMSAVVMTLRKDSMNKAISQIIQIIP